MENLIASLSSCFRRFFCNLWDILTIQITSKDWVMLFLETVLIAAALYSIVRFIQKREQRKQQEITAGYIMSYWSNILSALDKSIDVKKSYHEAVDKYMDYYLVKNHIRTKAEWDDGGHQEKFDDEVVLHLHKENVKLLDVTRELELGARNIDTTVSTHVNAYEYKAAAWFNHIRLRANWVVSIWSMFPLGYQQIVDSYLLRKVWNIDKHFFGNEKKLLHLEYNQKNVFGSDANAELKEIETHKALVGMLKNILSPDLKDLQEFCLNKRNLIKSVEVEKNIVPPRVKITYFNNDEDRERVREQLIPNLKARLQEYDE